MNPEDTEAMKLLDARLAKLHANVDARPGFEGRLEARIAPLRAQQAAPFSAEARERLELVHERERAEASRAARVEGLVVAIAGLGASVAAWQFAPELARLASAASTSLEPTMVTLGTLAVVVAALWALLRQFDVDLRSLIGA
jgi:hypothetical protein